MVGICRISSIAASIAFLCSAGCKYDSSFTKTSAEWDPQFRARNDALAANGFPPTKDLDINKGVTILQPSAGTQSARDWTIDPIYIISAPVYWIWDGLLHFVLTDTDPKSRPKFETRLFYADTDQLLKSTNPAAKAPEQPAKTPEAASPAAKSTNSKDAPTNTPPSASAAMLSGTNPAPQPPNYDLIKDNQTFEVHLTYLAIDYFTGGRLRDAWGGQGGEVSVQTSLNALSDAGMLVSEDTKFVVENEVKRRSPLLALAKGTAKGSEYVQKVTDRAKDILAKVDELKLDVVKIGQYVAKIQAAVGDRANELAKLRTEAISTVDDWIAKNVQGTTERELTTQIAHSIVNAVFDEISGHLNEDDANKRNDWLDAVGLDVAKRLVDADKALDGNAHSLGLIADEFVNSAGLAQAAFEKGKSVSADLRGKKLESIAKSIAALYSADPKLNEKLNIAKGLVDDAFNAIDAHLGDPNVGKFNDWVTSITDKAQRHLDHATAVLDYLGRYNVDEEGIYASAKIIVGLADADRRSTIEFENVKPSLIQFPGEAGGGTAATLVGVELNDAGGNVLEKNYGFWSRKAGAGLEAPPTATATPTATSNAENTADSATTIKAPDKNGDWFHLALRNDAIDQKPKGLTGQVISQRGLIYRGTLQELARTMTGVKGFSLSFLMIDRGDDRVVRALRTLQQYTDQSGITVGGGGAQIQLSAIVDGLATLAQRISEDKVELRTIDLRFMCESPRSGSTPGHELFALRPCTILISRNLKGNKFGAVAEITISRTEPAAVATPPPAPSPAPDK